MSWYLQAARPVRSPEEIAKWQADRKWSESIWQAIKNKLHDKIQTTVGADRVGFGWSLAPEPSVWLDISQEHQAGDLQGAINKIFAEIQRLSNDPQFMAHIKEMDDSIMKEQDRYYAGGGQNWSGD